MGRHAGEWVMPVIHFEEAHVGDGGKHFQHLTVGKNRLKMIFTDGLAVCITNRW